MSSYENSPACRLLATHCVACGRPLVDATSVERGMGPDCRKKYMVAPVADDQGRTRANFLVWEMALLISAVAGEDTLDQVARVTVANNLHELRAIGYDILANKLEAQWVQIKITEGPDGTYAVKAPYSEEVVADMRRIRGRRWDGRNKVNTFPVSARGPLWTLLIKHYPGFAGMGPKGSFVVPAPQPEHLISARTCGGCENCDGENLCVVAV